MTKKRHLHYKENKIVCIDSVHCILNPYKKIYETYYTYTYLNYKIVLMQAPIFTKNNLFSRIFLPNTRFKRKYVYICDVSHRILNHAYPITTYYTLEE